MAVSIPTDASVNVQRSFNQVNAELRALNQKMSDTESTVTQRELEDLRRELVKATQTQRIQFWNDAINVSFGVVSNTGGSPTDLKLAVHHHIYIPFPIRITGYTLIVNVASGVLEVDILMVPYSSTPGVGTSICGSELPFVSGFAGIQTNQNHEILTWTQNIPGHSILHFEVISASGCEQADLTLRVKKTHFE